FTELGILGIGAVDVDDDSLDVRRRFDRGDHVAAETGWWNVVTLAQEVVEEGIPQRRRAVAALQRDARAAALREPTKGLLRFHSEHELELPELVRLKAAGGVEPFAEAEELERRHGFQDVELRHHHLQDREDALQGVLRTVRIVRFQKLDDSI